MKVDIEERKKNPLIDRRSIKGTVDHTEEPTPSADSLRAFLSEELGTDEENIEIKKIFTIKGMHKSRFWADEFGEVSGEQEEVEKESEEEDVLGGSISDAKKAIENMEDPDYKKLLEEEKKNKDRKGMKNYLKGKIGE